MENIGRFLKKLKIKLPYDLAIPLLGIYPEKTTIQKDICTLKFTAALTIKRNEIGPFVVMWMNLESVIKSEGSQKEKNKLQILMYIYGI